MDLVFEYMFVSYFGVVHLLTCFETLTSVVLSCPCSDIDGSFMDLFESLLL